MMARTLRLTGGIAALVRIGLFGGVLLAGLLTPLAAVAGLGTKAEVERLDVPIETLPLTTPSQTSRVYAADGSTLIAQFFEEYRTDAPITQVSLYLQQAIVATEDARFFEHKGVDVKGMVRAFVANSESGDVSQGASTITMQYVRGVLRDTARTPDELRAATEQSSARKVREMKLAVQLEQRLSKTEILERYLNQAYFGHRAYGASAAAEVYFSKRVADLTQAEAALLAGLVQAPSTYDPTGDRRGAVARRDYVIDRMLSLGYLDAKSAATAHRAPLGLHLHEPANDCVASAPAHPGWGFFCDFVRSWWISQRAFGATPAQRLDRLRRGGYRIVTTLDPKVQNNAQSHVLAKERTTSPYAHGVVALEPNTGRVRAMAVNRVYALDRSGNGAHSDPRQRRRIRGNYPNTVNALLGGGNLPGYQAGSTFKLFVLLAALEQGVPLNTEINAPARYKSIFPSGRHDPSRCGDRWCPRNASASMTGVQTLWSGFGKSVNTFWVQLEQWVGVPNAVRMAERLGLTWHTDVDRGQASPQHSSNWGAFTLGVADTTPLELASAYATVAADGTYCEPLPVTSILDLEGQPVVEHSGVDGRPVRVAEPRCRSVVAPEVARGALDAARCVTGYGAAAGDCGGWSTAPSVYRIVKRPVAGKTGTTDNTRAAWFVGMTPTLTVAAFIADPDNPFHGVGRANHGKPTQTAAEVLRDALAGTPVLDFAPPSPYIAYGPTGLPRP